MIFLARLFASIVTALHAAQLDAVTTLSKPGRFDATAFVQDWS